MLIFSASLISVGLATCSPSAMHDTSYSWAHPGDTLRRSSGRSSALYSPTFGEGKFCELRHNGVLRSWMARTRGMGAVGPIGWHHVYQRLRTREAKGEEAAQGTAGSLAVFYVAKGRRLPLSQK